MVNGESAIARPGRGLRGAVSGYRGHRQLDAALSARPASDTTIISLVLGFPGDPDVLRGVAHAATTLPADPTITILIDSDWQGLQVDMTPMGAGRIIGVPANELAVGRHDLEIVLGPDATALIKKLSSSATWQVRFDAVDRFLRTRLEAAPPRSLSVGAAWRNAADSIGLIVVTPAGPVPVADAAPASSTYLDRHGGDPLPRSASGIAGH